jgi:site-specific recombinase XerD
MAEKNGSDQPSRSILTLSQWVDQWLPVADIQPITKKGYERVLRTYALPKLGDQQVSQISVRAISKLLDQLKAEGVGSATIAQVKASLGSAFKRLVTTGEIPSNPTHGLTVKARHADIQHVLTPIEFKELLPHLPTQGAKLLAQFLITSGCRFGEATEIRVKDFNLTTGEVFVQRRVSDLGSSYEGRFKVIDATKSGHKRSVMLSKALLTEIKAYVTAKALSKEDLLFSRSLICTTGKLEPSRGRTKSERPFAKDGKLYKHGTLNSYTHGGCRCDDCRMAVREYRQKRKPYQKRDVIDQSSHLPRDVWRTTWNKAIAKSGIGWSPRTHDLRHANATALLKNGVDLHEVKDRLGHQSIKTTERYLHRVRQQQSKASEVVNDYLE